MTKAPENKLSVLFVCLGNICRSPMAEGAFREAAAKAGLDAHLDMRIDSAGTADYHIGSPPDPRAIAAARAKGVDISGAQGRQLTASDFHEFTHIFALDTANLVGVRAREPRHGTAAVAMLLDAVGRGGEPVPDPYYGDDEGFAECWEVVSEACDAMVERFLAEGNAARF